MKKVLFTLGAFFILLGAGLMAQDIPDAPVPPRLVNDFAGLLSQGEAAQLEAKLVAFNDTTSTQISVVTITSLDGYSKEDYADRLAEKWGIGHKGKDNGVLILIKPKYANESGQVRISVGYGLEGAIPDALANRIVDYDMIPHFKEGNFYAGLDQATSTIMSLASGEFTADQYIKKRTPGLAGILVPIIIITIILVIFGRGGRGRHYSAGSRTSGSLWTAIWLGSILNSGRSGGSWGDFKGGGGSFGGGGGGGFGGFGGGSFGGGGAGGSW